LNSKSPSICAFDSINFYHTTKDINQQKALSIQNTCNCFVNLRADPFTCNFSFKIRSKATVGGVYALWPPPPPLSSLKSRTGLFSLLSPHGQQTASTVLGVNCCSISTWQIWGATSELVKWHFGTCDVPSSHRVSVACWKGYWVGARK
jgi:hypothetical protein